MKPRRGPSLTPCKPPRLSRFLRDRALSVIRRIISVRRTSFFFRSSIRPQTFVPSPCRKPEITNNQTTQAIDFVLTHFHPDGSPWDPLGAPLAFLWLLKRPTGSLWRLSPPLPNQGRPKSLAEDLLWVPWSLVHVDCCDTLGNKSPALRLCGDGQETCGYGGKADDHHRADTKDAAANVVGPVSKADVWAMFMTTTRVCTETHRSG